MALTADDIRAKGWSVAVHNDYRLHGTSMTFWLFTKDNMCAKGEGSDDASALLLVLQEIDKLEAREWKEVTGAARPFASNEPPGTYGLCWKLIEESARHCTEYINHVGKCGVR